MNADILSATEAMEDDPAISSLQEIINESWRKLSEARHSPDAIARFLFNPNARRELLTNPQFENAVDVKRLPDDHGERLFGIPIKAGFMDARESSGACVGMSLPSGRSRRRKPLYQKALDHYQILKPCHLTGQNIPALAAILRIYPL